MTRDDIIRMAREADAAGDTVTITPFLERFAAIVAAAEREACVESCQKLVMYGPVAEAQQRYNQAYWHCVDAIRARGNT